MSLSTNEFSKRFLPGVRLTTGLGSQRFVQSNRVDKFFQWVQMSIMKLCCCSTMVMEECILANELVEGVHEELTTEGPDLQGCVDSYDVVIVPDNTCINCLEELWACECPPPPIMPNCIFEYQNMLRAFESAKTLDVPKPDLNILNAIRVICDKYGIEYSDLLLMEVDFDKEVKHHDKALSYVRGIHHKRNVELDVRLAAMLLLHTRGKLGPLCRSDANVRVVAHHMRKTLKKMGLRVEAIDLHTQVASVLYFYNTKYDRLVGVLDRSITLRAHGVSRNLPGMSSC